MGACFGKQTYSYHPSRTRVNKKSHSSEYPHARAKSKSNHVPDT